MKRTWVVAVLLIAAGMALATVELTSARLYKKQGEWLKSLQNYDEELRKRPESLDAYFERGELLKEIAADPARAGLAKQIAGDKPNPQLELYDRMLADFREAQTARTAKDENTAKKLKKKIEVILQDLWAHFYSQAVQNDSSYARAVAASLETPDPRTFLQTAIENLDMAIRMVPGKWNAYGLKAQICGKLDDRRASAENWRLALEKIEASDMAKDDPQAYRQAIEVIRANLLEEYYSMDQYDDAMRLADEILRVEPENADAVQFKAFSLARKASDTTLTDEQRKAMKTQAITALQSARTSRPDEPVILYYIGQFHLQLGDTAQSVQAFQDYLKLDDADREVRFALGVIYLEGGSFANTVKARDEFAHLVAIDSTDVASWINYGIALIRLGDNVKGKQAIEKGKSLRHE
ncbi:MAG: tetratricopeptide repeat protein [bacterium]|nr:tetratricopeptide repeat protein [bacterium]